MSDAGSPVVKPDVVFIEELLGEIEEGTLRVPRFQRPFLWRPKQMTKLFDSISLGYPIGSLLLWETETEVQTLDSIGPLPQVPKPSRGVRYILDGHQRLSTLYGVLRLPKRFSKSPENNWKWWIWYDLRTNEFTQLRNGDPPSHFIELRALLRTMDFLTECRRIASAIADEAQELIESAELLAQKVKNYKVPINVVRGGMKQAVETFSRLNSSGRKMSTDQLVSALTYQEAGIGFHLDARIDAILNTLSLYHFGGISRTIVFRAIVAALEMDIYKTDWSKISSSIGPKLPSTVDSCEEALRRAAEFLANDLHVPSDRLLPYVLQIICLSEFFRECSKPTPQQLALLRRWFWVSSFSGWFAGANDSQVNETLNEFRELGRGDRSTLKSISLDDPARPFPTQFFMRSARVRTFALFMLSLKPRSLSDGRELPGEELVQRDGYNAFVYVDRQGSNPGNRMLLGAENRKHVLQQIIDPPPLFMDPLLRERVLQSHGISVEAIQLLKADDRDGFVTQRAAHLASMEREFMHFRNVTVPRADEPSDPDLDADDDDATPGDEPHV